MRVALVFVLTLASAVPATAQVPESDTPQLRWNDDWDRVRTGEIVAAGVLVVGVLGGNLLLTPDVPRVHGGVLFDDAVRNGMTLQTASGRRLAGTLSDILAITSVAWPLLLDAGLVVWGVHRSSDVAGQLFGMDALAFAATSFVLELTKNIVARERPHGDRCHDETEVDASCDSSNLSRSFYSGHTAMAFTGAGLTCVHHAHLPIYDSRAAGTAACIGAMTLATTVGLLRVMADKHWLTDVIVGALLGTASALAFTLLPHYGIGR